MKISVRGSGPISRPELKYVFNFFGQILLGKRLAENISINFYWKPCEYDADSIPIDLEKGRDFRKFELTMGDEVGYFEGLVYAAHEMEHVRQYARNELIPRDAPFFQWQGLGYKLTKKNYELTPWEVQARRTEVYLIRFYEKHAYNINLPFFDPDEYERSRDEYIRALEIHAATFSNSA